MARAGWWAEAPERYMWGQDVGEELSPQWSERDVEAMTAAARDRLRAGLPQRLAILTYGEAMALADRMHVTPKMSVERITRKVTPRSHFLTVRLRPSIELKRSEARELLASLFQTLDLNAKPYHVGRAERLEVYADKLEVGPT